MNSSYIAPYYPSPSLPSWYINDKEIFNGNKLIVKEWEQEEGEDGRLKQGFLGYDFCHSKYASVRILEYFLSNTSISSSNPSSSSPSSPSISSEFLLSSSPKLEGAVYFSPLSESHRGSSHGGSFCAIMDDAIGWMGFCASGECKPWSGYTVQINTSLKNPIPTGSLLCLRAWIEKEEGTRKIFIKASITDPIKDIIHCEATGLFLKSNQV